MADKVKQPLESLDECVAWVLSGCKAPRDFKIGTEYERFAIDKYGQPLPYDGAVSIRTLFDRLIARHGWQPLLENGHPIALLRNGASVSLEPAGQFELSGGAFATVAEMQAELTQHLAEVRDVAEDLGVTLAHVGYNPLMNVAQVPKMPKGRYAIMRKLMPQVGQNGLDMMHLTCTVQTNLDFSSEFECMQMHRLGHLLSPVLIALLPIRRCAKGLSPVTRLFAPIYGSMSTMPAAMCGVLLLTNTRPLPITSNGSRMCRCILSTSPMPMAAMVIKTFLPNR